MDAASARTHSPRKLIRPDLAATRSDISLSVRSISPIDTRQSKATMWSRPSWGVAVASSSSRRCMWAVTAWRRHILGSITIMPRSRSRGTASLMNERSSSVVRYTSQSPALSALRSAATRGESGSGRSGLRWGVMSWASRRRAVMRRLVAWSKLAGWMGMGASTPDRTWTRTGHMGWGLLPPAGSKSGFGSGSSIMSTSWTSMAAMESRHLLSAETKVAPPRRRGLLSTRAAAKSCQGVGRGL